MDNMETNSVLEQLRSDYSALKERLDQQEIINDRLLQQAFSTKLQSINSKAWVSIACGIFVVIVAPWTFHYNPSLNLSWAFVAATDVMMAVCVWFTAYWHTSVKLPDASKSSIKQFAQSVKTLKQRYQGWLKYAAIMLAGWLTWMFIELFSKTEDTRQAVIMMISLVIGGIVGGLIGLKMHFAVINKCDEILSQIEE